MSEGVVILTGVPIARRSRAESLHTDRLWETMDQMMDDEDECVLSADQLTLMKL